MSKGIGALGVVFFGLLLWRVSAMLSPALLTMLIWVFLYPLRRIPWAARTLTVATALLVLWLFHLAWHALSPFVWGAAIAYLLDPFVDRLQRLRIPRVVASLVLMLLLLGLIVAIGLLVLPTAAAQIREIIGRLPDAASAADRWLALTQQRLRDLGLPLEVGDIRQRILSADSLLSRLAQGALSITKALSTALSTVLTIILVVVVSFYALLRIDDVRTWLHGLIPPRMTALTGAFREIDSTIGSWFRGQLLIALLVGTLTFAGLTALSTPYAAVIGLVAGVLNIIPTIGLIVSVSVAVLLAPTVAQPWVYLLKVGSVFVVLQVLDNVVISVQIMRARLGLHPAVMILSVVVGASLIGPPGVLLAVPCAAMLRLGGRWACTRYRLSQFYQAGAPPPPDKEESPHAG